ncbi:MAG: type IV pilin N-terminal domain-containing protein [Thermoplasmata archaeon]|nr:type IV pilin N-terminal domain-containing protein [Thermoplasmata archaeon]
MKKIWRIRKDSEAVSPVIATILMVAITVVLAAVLYVMVLGFGGTSTQTPAATYQKNTITNGQKITIVSITKTDVPWDDVKIQVSDGTNIAAWSPTKAALSTTVAVNYTTQTLGSLTICVIVTDVSGNGYVSGTDYFQVFTYGGATAFASGTQYSAVLLYEPSGERCGQAITFTG